MKTQDSEDARGSETYVDPRPAALREHILSVVEEQTRPVELSEIANAIVASRRQQELVGNDDAVSERRVQTRLHHVDLPKLAAQSDLEYDATRHLVW